MGDLVSSIEWLLVVAVLLAGIGMLIASILILDLARRTLRKPPAAPAKPTLISLTPVKD